MSKVAPTAGQATNQQQLRQQQIRQQLMALKQGLEQEAAGYEDLHRLLQAQARLLTHQDHQGLLAHNPRQLQTTEELADKATLRDGLLQELGMTSLEALCQRLPAALAQTLLACWQKVQTQARQCRALNDSNGRLLASQKEWLEQRLGVTPSEYLPQAFNAQL